MLNARSSFDLMWILITGGGAFLVTFLTLAPKLLPIADTGEETADARRLFSNSCLAEHPSDHWCVTARKWWRRMVMGPAKHKPTRTTDDDDEGFYRRGVIVTDSTSVVVLRTNTGISRIVGPGTERDQLPSGVIFTEWDETIDAIIDLRPQVRITLPPFQATTNDGMTVDARVTAFFSLKRVKARRLRDLAYEPMRWPPPFTWHVYPVWQVLNTRRMLHKGDKLAAHRLGRQHHGCGGAAAAPDHRAAIPWII